MKKILVLGGTMFVGRALVEKLIALPEYEITLFNRGKSNANLFLGIKQIHGNRETDDILQICNQHWDCIIDFSGYYPVTFEKLLGSLKGKVNRYIFISTLSVYDLEKFVGRTITEADEILSCSEEQKISKLPDAYGEKKAEMERALHKQDWLDKIILRPSFIYGRYDWTERLYYWLYRAKFFDRMLMPRDFNVGLSYSDDLVNGILNAIEVKEHQTVYNTISIPDASLHKVVTVASAILNRKVDFVEVTDTLLEKSKIEYSSFPLFVPFNLAIEGTKWLSDFSVSSVDFKTTIADTLQYHESLGWSVPKAGLNPDKEKEILGI
ncbi:MAG: NAD-dependent epimerase/dehydratase family protein [Bacteroidota bacterium]